VAVAMMLQLDCPVDGVGEGATPLHRASFSGAVAAMRILIEHKANLLAKDASFHDKMTPLHKAAAGGRYLAVQLLLEALRSFGKLNQALIEKDRGHRTPLQVANELRKIQQSERESVARWDQVAGGVADWDKCAQLLSSAEQVKRSTQQSNKTNNNDSFAISLPESISRMDYNCIDCGQDDNNNGFCVIASWQSRFQASLGNCIPVAICSKDYNDQTLSANHLTTPDHFKNPEITIAKEPKSPDDDDNGAGVCCSTCSKVTIALYPIRGGKLVCKACKRAYK
jgi:hypothetical protein